MRRSLVYGVAGAAFGLALVLTLAGVGDDPAALTNPQALVLGLVQGFTELLPISSSGHLILVPWAARLDVSEGERPLQPDLRRRATPGNAGCGRRVLLGRHRAARPRVRPHSRKTPIETSDERIAWFVLVATIPAGVVGLVGRMRSPTARGAVADRDPPRRRRPLALVGGRTPQERTMGDLGMRHAVAMGLAQALALAPGVSRSGITITAGRLMRLDRDAAARFSFLLLLPTVLGALVLKGLGDVLLGDLPRVGRACSS